ncbi:MAG: APC family permease [Crocinitomicaceae bacterium]
MENHKEKYTLSVAVNVVIASMVGTGIFTALGFQVADGAIPDGFSILVIWALGGLLALCGATVYGEVASYIGKSGGEYTFLTELYHPIIGFLSGWISLFVGFSAAIASLALATGEYILPFLGVDNDILFHIASTEITTHKVIGFGVILIVALIQFGGVAVGSVVQNALTGLKLAMIVFFLCSPFLVENLEWSTNSLAPSENSFETILSLPFAGALVWVMFSYSGWNASSYIVGHLKDAKRTLPLSLLLGTFIVAILYIALNVLFMLVANFDELAGRVDIANIVAEKMYGAEVALMFSLIFSMALVAGINAMFISGPRVTEQMGQDYPKLQLFAKKNEQGAPYLSIIILFFISGTLVVFSSFKEIIEYVGITLSMFSMLTVAAVFIVRRRSDRSDNVVKAIGYPVTPILFIIMTLWMIVYFVVLDPMTMVYSLLSLVPGIIVYFLVKK